MKMKNVTFKKRSFHINKMLHSYKLQKFLQHQQQYDIMVYMRKSMIQFLIYVDGDVIKC